MVVYPSIWEVIIGLSILYFCLSTMIKDQIKYYKSQKRKTRFQEISIKDRLKEANSQFNK